MRAYEIAIAHDPTTTKRKLVARTCPDRLGILPMPEWCRTVQEFRGCYECWNRRVEE